MERDHGVNLDELRHLGETATEWTRKRSVGIYIGAPEPKAIGTGVVVEIGGRCFVATVAHNFTGVFEQFEGRDIFVSVLTDGRMVSVPVPEWELMPDEAGLKRDPIGPVEDLALGELELSRAESAGLIPATLDDLGPGVGLKDETQYGISGLHWESMESHRERSRILDQHGDPVINRVVTFTYHCRITHAAAESCQTPGELVLLYEKEARHSDGEVRPSRSARGMSGGGVWEILAIEEPQELHFRLIGLTRAVKGPSLFAIPIAKWLSMLWSWKPELRSAFPEGERPWPLRNKWSLAD